MPPEREDYNPETHPLSTHRSPSSNAIVLGSQSTNNGQIKFFS